ncbi:MAG: TolC family protein [Clostridiales bacterium]|nr:TolC family protein [Clostridiales bacterium]MCF8023374.1 TolC family protein [Clostridiales bacterium]
MRRAIFISILITILSIGWAVSGFAAEEKDANQETNGLTLNEAVDQALHNCIDVELAEKSVDKAWEERESARDGYVGKVKKYPNTDIPAMYAASAAANEPFFSYLAAHGKWRISKESLEMTEDALVLQAKQYYYNILQHKKEIETKQAELEKAESDLEVIRAKQEVGMATSVQVQGQKSSVERIKSELKQKQAALQKNYRQFKKLLGIDRDEEINLVSPVEYEQAKISSLDNKIVWALSPDNNPYLFMKKEQYDISKYTWTMAVSSEAGHISKEKKGMQYQDARKEMRNKMHELYDNLNTLESSYYSTQEAVKSAREGLRVTEQMYEVGMVTQNDVLDSKVKLEQARDALSNIKINYALAKETFEKPWLAMQ